MILMIVKRPGGLGTFVADALEREGETWTARGRWKYGSGRLSDPPASYTWPCRRVLEIRHDWTAGS